MVKVITNSLGKVYTANGKALLARGFSGKYQLFDRISDDLGNEIGTVSGFFTDSNNTEYAIVCLDAQYRASSGTWCSNTTQIPNMASLYDALTLFANKDTATSNTQNILDYCTNGGYTSSACSHCRNQSFTIDNVTYYGQLPNMKELLDIVFNYVTLDANDISVGDSLQSMLTSPKYIWSSSQDGVNGWIIRYNGTTTSTNKSSTYCVVPVLEIPIINTYATENNQSNEGGHAEESPVEKPKGDDEGGDNDF